jgi:hypothetical protein
MDYWVINRFNNSFRILNYDDYLENSKELSFAIFDNSENLKINLDDNIILLDGRSRNKLFFRNLSKVIKIDKSIKIDDEAGFQNFQSYLNLNNYRISYYPEKSFVHLFTIKIEEEYKDSKPLEDFNYTLICVRDFNKPYSSFTSIKKIQEIDYLSIRYNKIFLSRTCFGHIVNALPLETRFDIVISLLSHFNTDEPYGIDFNEALKFVKTYIDQKILSVGSYLMETANIVSESFANQGFENKIGFIENPKNFNGDKIKVQAAYFSVLQKISMEYSFWDKVLGQIQESTLLEEEYNMTFKKERWPINLNF